MLFRRLIWCALGMALLLGSMQTALQRWQALPIILAAEAFEEQKAAPAPAAAAQAHDHAAASDHHHDGHSDAATWAPADGAERTFWTWVANVLHAFSMALFVFAVMGLWVWKHGAATGAWRLAGTVAAAGWLSLHLWPSLGLPAEVPGMEAGALGARQAWWALAASCAALACATLAFSRLRWRWAAAAALLAVPFVVGAPQLGGDPLAGFSGAAHARMQQLARDFAWATTWVSLSFWITMAVAAALVFERWFRPALASAMGGSATASAPATGAVR